MLYTTMGIGFEGLAWALLKGLLYGAVILSLISLASAGAATLLRRTKRTGSPPGEDPFLLPALYEIERQPAEDEPEPADLVGSGSAKNE